ncbi:hypothetical protein [Bordetella sp. LUAb4]|uniref:hypothetical protein n=1 Tax=Bordetella sp. LUAb4 TaxID=2843195 RepID=UPI001E636C26|nr:hypothetical protein [Bordetella sp. LUAb4]
MDGQFNDNVQIAEWIKWVFGSGAMGALASGLVLFARRMWRNDQIAAVDTTESTRSTKALGDLTASLFEENRKLRAELDHKNEMLIALYRDLHGLDHPPAPGAASVLGAELEAGHGPV